MTKRDLKPSAPSPVLAASSRLMSRTVQLYRERFPTSDPNGRLSEADWVECSRKAREEMGL